MSSPAIVTHGISKSFGSVRAVRDVHLEVSRGDIYGFLGRNGAGKSTVIRMLLGMIRPTAGHAEILGRRVRPDATDLWRQVGHLVEAATAYPELTVRENLELARRLQGERGPSTVENLINRLALDRYADRRAGKLSLGNLQRLALARALLHRPPILILDEPANGLDPAGVIEIRALLRELALQEGVTVFMSSHVLGEVARLATRVGIIHQGVLLAELTSSELEERADRRLEVATRSLAAARKTLEKAGFAPVMARAGDRELLILREERAVAAPDEIARLLTEAGDPPTHLAVQREDLESYFMRLTESERAR